MRAADYLVQALAQEGVEVVFGYPGGAIMPIYDALVDAPFKHVLVRHEQGAALAADGYARATGKVGVCLATSGPGATNLVTGIANAYLDSVPMVAITGQVSTDVLGTDAFQEVDMLGITLPVVKHSFLPKKPEDLVTMIPEAFRIARSGRPGPVLVDIPKDVAMAEVKASLQFGQGYDEPEQPDLHHVRAAANLLRSSQKPVIYAGGGIGMANAVEEFRAFVTESGIPVVSTLKALGTLPSEHPQFLGMLGMHGLKAANMAVMESDLLIVIGARFDDRATGKLDTFAPNAAIIHMDIDAAELGKLRRPHVAPRGDIRTCMKALSFPAGLDSWQDWCQTQKACWAWNYDAPVPGIYAPGFLRDLSLKVGPKTIVSCDVGQHQMWVAQHFAFHAPYQHLSSGGLGTMGYGLPAAIGAAWGKPDHTVILVSGDGSIMMNIQELATLNRYQIPVKIVLFDNQRLGMVRQWQELFYKQRFSEVDLSDNPEFVRVAESFGIPGMKITRKEEVAEAQQILLDAPGSFFLHVRIDAGDNVWPLVPPGKSNAQMMEGAR